MRKTGIIKKAIILSLLLSLSGPGEIALSSQLPESLFGNQEFLELSLNDVTKLALENSLDIQIAKFDVYIERTSLEKAESIFDTIFDGEFSYTHDRSQPLSTLAGEETKEQKFSLGLEKKIPSGTTFGLDLIGTKTRTDSTISPLNPYHEALVELSITQELGKNFFGLADRSGIKITKIDIANAEFTSLDVIEIALSDAQKAYWNFVLKTEELLIKEDMRLKAQKLYNIYQDRFSLGLTEESELLAIEALLKTRQSDVETANLEKETAKNELLFLINRGDFERSISVKDSLACKAQRVNLYQSLKNATENRRDYQRIKNDLKSNDIDIVVKRNALWPQIDLEATFSRNNLDSVRSQAWGNLGESNDAFTVKLNFKVPLENREAQAGLRQANLEKKRSLLKFKRLERLILQELNDKVNQVNTMQNQVKLFESTLKIHKKKLAKQIKRLESGRSDANTLIDYEEDLLNARLKLVEYFFKYRRSIIDLDLAKNTLLDKYWQEPL